jgi:NAD dependent epimerase/dehydratase family enzyme
LPLFKLGLGGRFGSGRQWWSWITLDDEVRAMTWLLENDVHGPLNLTAPNPVTNREFTRVLSTVLSRPAVFPVPRFGPRLLVGSELADALLFTSARVQPAVLESSGFSFSHASLEAGLREMLRTSVRP